MFLQEDTPVRQVCKAIGLYPSLAIFGILMMTIDKGLEVSKNRVLYCCTASDSRFFCFKYFTIYCCCCLVLQLTTIYSILCQRIVQCYVTADQPGAQEGGRSHHPSLDCTGKLHRRPGAAGLTGAGSVEGSVSAHKVLFGTFSKQYYIMPLVGSEEALSDLTSLVQNECCEFLLLRKIFFVFVVCAAWLLQQTEARRRGGASCDHWEGGGGAVVQEATD